MAPLSGSDVDFVGFAHVVEIEFFEITARFLDFVDKVENEFVVTVEITSDLSGQLRSHLLDDVEHLFESEAVLAENRVCKVVEVGFAVLTPVLLGVLAGGSTLHNLITTAVDARHRLAEPGETETFEAALTWWKKHLR